MSSFIENALESHDGMVYNQSEQHMTNKQPIQNNMATTNTKTTAENQRKLMPTYTWIKINRHAFTSCTNQAA